MLLERYANILGSLFQQEKKIKIDALGTMVNRMYIPCIKIHRRTFPDEC